MGWIIVGLVGLSLIVFVCIPSAKQGHARHLSFLERFRPISDDEFLARCQPGTRRDAALGVRRILAEYLGVEYERNHPNAKLAADLGAE